MDRERVRGREAASARSAGEGIGGMNGLVGGGETGAGMRWRTCLLPFVAVVHTLRLGILPVVREAGDGQHRVWYVPSSQDGALQRGSPQASLQIDRVCVVGSPKRSGM